MVQADASDHGHQREEYIGGVQSPTQADLDHRYVNLGTSKGVKRQDSHHLEGSESDTSRFDMSANRGNLIHNVLLVDVLGAQPDTFAEIDQMRRSEETDAVASGAQHGVQQHCS
jgi:hypothetical protein